MRSVKPGDGELPNRTFVREDRLAIPVLTDGHPNDKASGDETRQNLTYLVRGDRGLSSEVLTAEFHRPAVGVSRSRHACRDSDQDQAGRAAHVRRSVIEDVVDALVAHDITTCRPTTGHRGRERPGRG
jgi:hypothetical protein